LRLLLRTRASAIPGCCAGPGAGPLNTQIPSVECRQSADSRSSPQHEKGILRLLRNSEEFLQSLFVLLFRTGREFHGTVSYGSPTPPFRGNAASPCVV